MLRLLHWLAFGHIHKWKMIDRANLTTGAGRRGARFYQQCEHCGKIVKRDLV